MKLEDYREFWVGKDLEGDGLENLRKNKEIWT
jgi:hypothetical protein